MLPTRTPEIAGLEVGTAYRPAGRGDEIGGDFYDVFPIADGRWAAVIGDVCGKGVEAARVTSLVRYTIRTAAGQTSDPAEVMRICNGAFLSHDGRRLTTALYVTVDPGTPTRIKVVRAGHLPPLVVRRSGEVEVYEGDGAILGLFESPSLDVVDIELASGDSLVMVTDGITDARNATSMLGEDGAIAWVAGMAGAGAQVMADGLCDRAVDYQDGYSRDDIAVVVLRAIDPT